MQTGMEQRTVSLDFLPFNGMPHTADEIGTLIQVCVLTLRCVALVCKRSHVQTATEFYGVPISCITTAQTMSRLWVCSALCVAFSIAEH